MIAFQVPNLLRSLVADSALSAAFVPVFTELEEQGRRREAQRLVGALIGLITMGLGAVTLVAIVAAPWMMPLFAPGLDHELVDQTVELAQIMFPIVVLLGLTGLVAAVLQAQRRVRRHGVRAGALERRDHRRPGRRDAAGARRRPHHRLRRRDRRGDASSSCCTCCPRCAARARSRSRWACATAHVRRVLVLMLPVTLGLGLININLLVGAIFATLVSDDSPRAIDAAFRLYLLPQGVFSVAIATVLFPTISRLAARDDVEGMRRTLAHGLRQIFFMLLPASAFLLVLSEPVVRLVFQRGEFDAASTSLTSEALVFFAIGLAFNGASLLVIRAFFSLQLPWLATKVAALGVVLNAASTRSSTGRWARAASRWRPRSRAS